MSKKQGYCEINGCRNRGDMIYYEHHICEACWDKHCNNGINLKEMLKVNEK